MPPNLNNHRITLDFVFILFDLRLKFSSVLALKCVTLIIFVGLIVGSLEAKIQYKIRLEKLGVRKPRFSH